MSDSGNGRIWMRLGSHRAVQISVIFGIGILMITLALFVTSDKRDNIVIDSKWFAQEAPAHVDAQEPPVVNHSLSVTERINRDIAIGILTTKKFHPRIREILKSWWDVSKYPNLVTVWTDNTEQDPQNPIPNLMNPGCDSSYHYGLWCKNYPMILHWRSDPKYKNTKWFMRVMDDSYVHLENLLHLTEQYDHLDPIVLGDKFCIHGFAYPSGGPGILISRGALNAWDTRAWFLPETERRNRNGFVDDVLWGEYLVAAMPKVNFIQHHGITQNHYYTTSPIFKYYQKFKDPNLRWPLPFRVIATHQHRSDMTMKQLHDELHAIHYEPVNNVTVPIKECKCPDFKSHQRCNYDQARSNGPCHYENVYLECISEGPWPYL